VPSPIILGGGGGARVKRTAEMFVHDLWSLPFAIGGAGWRM